MWYGCWINKSHLFLRVLLKIHSFVFVFGRKRQKSFVFVSFSAVNVKPVFGRSLVYNNLTIYIQWIDFIHTSLFTINGRKQVIIIIIIVTVKQLNYNAAFIIHYIIRTKSWDGWHKTYGCATRSLQELYEPKTRNWRMRMVLVPMDGSCNVSCLCSRLMGLFTVTLKAAFVLRLLQSVGRRITYLVRDAEQKVFKWRLKLLTIASVAEVQWQRMHSHRFAAPFA